MTQLSVGGKLSDEHDFVSATVNASIAHDFNEKNTTLSFGVNDEYDSLKPIGGAPLPGSDYALFQKTGNKSKNGVAALLGVTQVISRTWLIRAEHLGRSIHGILERSIQDHLRSSTTPAIPPDINTRAVRIRARARARIGTTALPGHRKCRPPCRSAILRTTGEFVPIPRSCTCAGRWQIATTTSNRAFAGIDRRPPISTPRSS